MVNLGERLRDKSKHVLDDSRKAEELIVEAKAAEILEGLEERMLRVADTGKRSCQVMSAKGEIVYPSGSSRGIRGVGSISLFDPEDSSLIRFIEGWLAERGVNSQLVRHEQEGLLSLEATW